MRTTIGRIVWRNIIEKNGVVHRGAIGATQCLVWHDMEEGAHLGWDSSVSAETRCDSN